MKLILHLCCWKNRENNNAVRKSETEPGVEFNFAKKATEIRPPLYVTFFQYKSDYW